MKKLKILGWWHVVANGLALAVVLWLCVVIALSPDKESRAPQMILPFLFMVSAFLLIPGFVGGLGLLQMRQWARFLMIALSMFYLLLVPIGPVIGGLGLWVLLGREALEAFSQEAASRANSTPGPGEFRPAPSDQLALLVIIAGVGAGFAVVLGAGFLISGDKAPDELMMVFYPAIPVLLGALGYAGYRWFGR